MGKAKIVKPEYATFKDERDGQTYRTVKMPDGKVWMAQNLNYKPESGNSWCYDNDESMDDKYGRLYDWETAMKACPKGWHLPSCEEWNNLISAAGGYWGDYAAVMTLKAKTGWNGSYGKNGNGTDDYGFSALPGGYRDFNGNFYYAGIYGSWWTSTAKNNSNNVYSRDMDCSLYFVDEDCNDKDYGRSVRCIQDCAGSSHIPPHPHRPNVVASKTKLVEPKQSDVDGSGTFTDERDGQTYRTVKMPDGKVWMAQNLNYKPESGNSWCYGNDESMGEKYGRLYDWDTAMAVSPVGWHLPSREEWEELVSAAGGIKTAAKMLKSKVGWEKLGDRSNCNGTDEFGFSALPGGYYFDDIFDSIGDYGYWWTATEYSSDEAFFRYMARPHDFEGIKKRETLEKILSAYNRVFERISDYKDFGHSVRCVKNDADRCGLSWGRRVVRRSVSPRP